MRSVRRTARPGQPRTSARRRPPPRPWVLLARRAAVLVLAVVLVGGGGAAFWRSETAARWSAAARDRLIAASAGAGFVVGRVYSEGRRLADEKELTRTLEPHFQEPIFSVDLDTIRQEIEALPWVRSASVGRRLPDTIWVRIDEHRPVARWMDSNRQVLVSDTQEIFRVKNASRYRELPLLFGKGAPARTREILELVASEPELAKHVTGARLVGERRWDVYLDGRIEVRLPADRPQAAWRRLAKEQKASGLVSRAVTSIDLRNPDWLTLELPDSAIGQNKEPRA